MSKVVLEEGNDGESKDCMASLKDFFDHHGLEDSRNALWKWLNVSGSQGFGDLSQEEQDELILFYENLQKLLEAVHQVRQSFDKDRLLSESARPAEGD